MLDTRRPLCSHRPIRPTSPTKGGKSLSRCLAPREAWPTAQVVLTPGRGRHLLPAQERLLVEDATAGVPFVAKGLLPLPALAPRRAAEASPRSPARGVARGGGARPGPQRGRDRQPGRQDHPGGRARSGRSDYFGGATARGRNNEATSPTSPTAAKTIIASA